MSIKDDINEALEPEPNKQKPWAEISPDGGELSTGVISSPLNGDWTSVLVGFGLDPDVFEVVGDTVRMSKWQSSKRLENGDRDLIWLYSYRASFRRKPFTELNESDFEDLRQDIKSWKPLPKAKIDGDGVPETFVVCWADQQIGKSAGGGTTETVERILKSFEDTASRIKQLRRLGHNITEIAIINMGDPIEGCDGNYASQLFTVELTQRQQLVLVLDLWSQGIRTLATLAEKTRFISVLCNHGEWMRRGGKSVTSDSDNASGFISDALQRILKDRPETQDVSWTVPHDEMITTAELSGIKLAFTHGHKITGKEVEWLRGQSIRILREQGREPDIWVTAHRHHLQVQDFGPWYRFQCPSNDGGSKWYTDMTGNWSTPGTLTFVVGEHDKRGWSDMAVL